MNPFLKLISPSYPSSAIGLDSDAATAVSLQRTGRGKFSVRRGASIAISRGTLVPGFNETNIKQTESLRSELTELVTAAGLLRQRTWSISLPEAAARTVIISIDSKPASKAEREEVVRWKMERGFGFPLQELNVARIPLLPDGEGKERFLATAIRTEVQAEYEALFASLGWRAGLLLPRNVGETCWLTRLNGKQGSSDNLLLSSHEGGFTAVVVRDDQPLIVREIQCDQDDREDELYRLLLFYRDRLAQPARGSARALDGFVLLGHDFTSARVRQIIGDTLESDTRQLSAEDLGLTLPLGDLSFDLLAGPAGLASLAWS